MAMLSCSSCDVRVRSSQWPVVYSCYACLWRKTKHRAAAARRVHMRVVWRNDAKFRHATNDVKPQNVCAPALDLPSEDLERHTLGVARVQ
eukprot:4336031-Prymnesium_polylepis.1